MDGYAIQAVDVRAGSPPLRIIGEVPAGAPPEVEVKPGSCVRIMTGAAVPQGADSVVPWEQTREKDGLLFVTKPVPCRSHIIVQAEDAKAGDILIKSGTRLSAVQVGLCASVGLTHVQTFRQPVIALIGTGNELKDPGHPVEPHEIRNSNGPMLAAALATWGFPGVRHAIVSDQLPALTRKLASALARGVDVILLTGGVSKGKYDLVQEAILAVGGHIRFHGVTIKPGKPILYARHPNGCSLFGLTGNPLGALTGFYQFALPVLRRLSGTPWDECCHTLNLPLAKRVVTKGGRTHFIVAQLRWSAKGPHAWPIDFHSAADLVGAARGDGFIIIPPTVTEIPPGDMVEFCPWQPLPW